MLTAQAREWFGQAGEFGREVLLGAAQRRTVRGRRGRCTGGSEMAKKFDRLGVRIDEGHADALGHRARNQQLNLELLSDAVDEQREEQHGGRIARHTGIGNRVGADEHATDAEIAHGASHRRPSGDADQALEIDRDARKAPLFGAAAMFVPCCH